MSSFDSFGPSFEQGDSIHGIVCAALGIGDGKWALLLCVKTVGEPRLRLTELKGRGNPER
jgi:hypothetical protein